MEAVEALALLLVAFAPSHALHALADLNVGEPWKAMESYGKPWKSPHSWALKHPMPCSGSNAHARAQFPLAEGSPAG